MRTDYIRAVHSTADTMKKVIQQALEVKESEIIKLRAALLALNEVSPPGADLAEGIDRALNEANSDESSAPNPAHRVPGE